MNKPVYSLTHVKASLLQENSHPKNTIYYSFGDEVGYDFRDKIHAEGFYAFTDAQKAAARLAVSMWDDLIGLDIKELSSFDKEGLHFGNTTYDTFHHAYGPGDRGGYIASYSFMNPSKYISENYNLFNPTLGKEDFISYLWGVGFQLGMKNISRTYYQDTVQYTIMSAYNESYSGADYKGVAPQTPMVHDILAIQAKYGADTETRKGDTVYGFGASNDTPFYYDFSKNSNPVLTIYDARGNDTLNVSRWSSNSEIDLTPGTYSSVNGMKKNIGIAYSTTIENVVTGSGSDMITGNHASNRISSGASRDTISGGRGNDTINGGHHDDRIMGGIGNDVVIGGHGSDRLFGDEGNDRLHGNSGRDVMKGGSGSDIFFFERPTDTTFDVIVDFVDGEDKISIASIFRSLGKTTDQLMAENYLMIQKDADSANIWIDLDGAGTVHSWVKIVEALNTQANYDASDFIV